MPECNICEYTFYDIIRQFRGQGERAIELFQQHGVIPAGRNCGVCGKPCTINLERRSFRCNKQRTNKKNKRVTKCSYSVSLFTGTWLENSHLSPSQNLLFINEFVRKRFTQRAVQENIGIASNTVVNWKNFCGLVCVNWMDEQEAIGGPGSIIEIKESKFGKSHSSGRRAVESVWVFGGIDRHTKKQFIVPVEGRDSETLIPLCQKYIKPGSTIYSDFRKAYAELGSLGYVHQMVKRSQSLVDPDTGAHTKNIKKLWKDIKRWVLRAGVKKTYYRQYFARYLFIHAHPDHHTILHYFLKAIARAFPPPQ
ncbi:hypothetical protein OTU49_005444 [Cherax quadricarinatus]|uniref:ISXO2-like transposase domain-containing protein n=1 Tax=Cherax quadricarinatus TaxID=27406 RepID=A0AAW0X7F5_CHEQU